MVLVRSHQKVGRLQTYATRSYDDKLIVREEWNKDPYGDHGYRHWVINGDMAEVLIKVLEAIGLNEDVIQDMSDKHIWITYSKDVVSFDVWLWPCPDWVDVYPSPKTWLGIEL